MGLDDWQVTFHVRDSHSLELWMRLGSGQLHTYDQIQLWLHTQYQAQVVDLEPGSWLIQFPDAKSHTQFVLTWC